MTRIEVCQWGAAELARRIARGETSATDVVEAHITRIERSDERIRAVVVKRYAQAREEARAIDRRRAAGEPLPALAGVPVTVKECLDLADTPSSFGLQWRRDLLASADDAHVRRLRQAGAIVLGKTNLSQLLIYLEADNPVYGRSHNPWNVERTCGGSSGGEAAILAAGGSALGLGTDIGGSCRNPAAFCGIAGFKPTSGRCPDPGRYSVPYGQRAIASEIGVLARHVEDLALGLATIEGCGRDPLLPPTPLGDWRDIEPARLRIGYYLEDGVMPSSPAVRRAVLQAAAYLRAAGAQVLEWQPPGLDEAHALSFSLMGADAGRGFREHLRGTPAHPTVQALRLLAGRSRATLRPLAAVLRAAGQATLAEFALSFGYTRAADYWALCERQQHYRHRFVAGMQDAEGGPLDLILGPACALPAFRHGTSRDLGLGGAHAVFCNLLGFPAGVVPVSRVRADEQQARPSSHDLVLEAARRTDEGSAGLPVAVQLVARPWREHEALAAMQVVEAAARREAGYPETPLSG